MTAPDALRVEASLREDLHGEYRRQILEEFQTEANNVRLELEKGVDPATYQKGEALLRGLQTASRQVERFWNECHVAGKKD